MGSRPTPSQRIRRLTSTGRGALVVAIVVALGACGDTGGAVAPTMPPQTVAPVDDRPNVVLVLTDDQTLEQLRFLEQSVQRLSSRGVSFEEAVVSYPTCCPSRATILTGQYASNHGVLWNAPPTGGFTAFRNHETAMPAALADAGYETIHVGRFLNGYGFLRRDRVQPEGWTDWHAIVAPTDGQYTEFSLLENGDLVTYGPDDYVTDVLADIALDAVDRAVERGRPFFLQLSFTAPHASYGSPLAEVRAGSIEAEIASGEILPPVPAPRHAGSLFGLELPSASAFDEADRTDKPSVVRDRGPIDAAGIRAHYQAEAESLLAVDEAVIALLDQLETLGVAERTYVVFTSDNGFFHGEHGIALGKYLPYEETLRVPLLIAGPGIPEGETRSSLVANIDLAPTILEWTDVEPRREMDGISLTAVLAAEPPELDRAIFIEGHAPGGFFRAPYRGVRTSDWIYIEWEGGEVELYDLGIDPSQLTNLAADPAHATTLETMAALTEQLASCSGASCQVSAG